MHKCLSLLQLLVMLGLGWDLKYCPCSQWVTVLDGSVLFRSKISASKQELKTNAYRNMNKKYVLISFIFIQNLLDGAPV